MSFLLNNLLIRSLHYLKRTPVVSARTLSTQVSRESNGDSGPKRSFQHAKHKIPRKRASYLLGIIQKEALARRPLNFPSFGAGDAIECKIRLCMSDTRTENVRGIVLGRFNRGIASSFIIRDVFYEESIERRIPLYSPFLQSIRIIKRRAIYEGKQEGKRVRPSKIYYLRNLDIRHSMVTGRKFKNLETQPDSVIPDETQQPRT